LWHIVSVVKGTACEDRLVPRADLQRLLQFLFFEISHEGSRTHGSCTQVRLSKMSGLVPNGGQKKPKQSCLVAFNPIFNHILQDIAFAEIIALWVSIAATIYLFYGVDKTAGYLLTPYIAW
jgi:hypothetical protein